MFSIIKKPKLLICIFFAILFLILIFFSYYNLNNNDIAVTINGEPIYENEIENALNRYEGKTDITREDFITIAAKEVLVVQEADKLGITIESNDLDQRIKILKEDYPKFYDLAIKQYKNISVYKEALKYRMLYNKVKEKIVVDYLEANPFDDETLKQKMVQEGIINEKDFNNSKYNDLKLQFKKQNNENRGNKYFEEWTNSLLNTAEVEYVSTQYRYSYRYYY